jgi:hypothetical protein
VGSAGSASAACAKANLKTGHWGPGTELFVSTTSTCNDLNLIHAEDHNSRFTGDRYSGYYKSGNSWIQGSVGWVYTSDFTARSSGEWFPLIFDIRNGARVGVASDRDGGDDVTVAH